MISNRSTLTTLAAAVAAVGLVCSEVGRVSARQAAEGAASQIAQPDEREPRPPIEVTVDATKVEPAASGDVVSVCGVAPDAARPWLALMREGGARLAAVSGSAEVGVLAERREDGFLVALANQTGEKVSVRLSFRTAPGVYTCEKVALDTRTADSAPRFERLQGAVIGARGQGWKPVWLPGHGGNVLRIMNRTSQVERAYRDLRSAVAATARVSPHLYRRLMPALRECEGHVAAISAREGDREGLAAHAHQALLKLALVQAFARNEGSGLADPASGSLLSKTDAFEAALTELSASALGLVANVHLAKQADGTVRQSIEVTNTGEAGISVVKVWPKGPEGTTISPSEPRVLGRLPRGATGSATFAVRLAEGASASDLVAHVSYRFAGSPAHLRLKAP